jgi:hypothetical protein
VFNERNEVTIQEKQWEAVFYAESRNDDIRGFSDRNPFFTERSIIVGALPGHLFAEDFVLVQSQQALFGLAVIFVVANSLQDFQKYEVTNRD